MPKPFKQKDAFAKYFKAVETAPNRKQAIIICNQSERCLALTNDDITNLRIKMETVFPCKEKKYIP